MGLQLRPLWAVLLIVLEVGAQALGAGCNCRERPEPAGSVKDGVARQLTDERLRDGFETGRSLVIAEVLSVRTAIADRSTMYCYRVRVAEAVIPGDCAQEDFASPLELSAGASYGSALKPGSTYALFVTKDCPFLFSWCHRDDVAEIDPSDTKQISSLVEAARGAYQKTAIRAFRESASHEQAALASPPPDLVSQCDEFRAAPGNRTASAKMICASELGSRLDESHPWRSVMEYLPPKMRLSRAQLVSLLGEPTLKCGRKYSWLCGRDAGSDKREDRVGVVSAWFDESSLVAVMTYGLDLRSRWE